MCSLCAYHNMYYVYVYSICICIQYIIHVYKERVCVQCIYMYTSLSLGSVNVSNTCLIVIVATNTPTLIHNHVCLSIMSICIAFVHQIAS